jgi:hypothetical protein
VIITIVFILHWTFLKDRVYPYFHDLRDVVHTYSRFHAVKGVKLKYPGAAEAGAQCCPLVPRIMHQIWLDEDSGKDVERYEAARNSCTTLHKREEG